MNKLLKIESSGMPPTQQVAILVNTVNALIEAHNED